MPGRGFRELGAEPFEKGREVDALDLAPVTKLLFATDASRAPEMFFLAARWWRDALAGALSELVAGGWVEETAALEWARMVLAGNAHRLYDLA